MLKNSMKSNTKTLLIAIAVVIAVVVVWGLIGSSQAAAPGIDCDIGIGGDDGSVFCWKWHKNALGKVSDSLNSLVNKK